MHPVKAVPIRCNPFVHGEKPKKTIAIPIKTPKTLHCLVKIRGVACESLT